MLLPPQVGKGEQVSVGQVRLDSTVGLARNGNQVNRSMGGGGGGGRSGGGGGKEDSKKLNKQLIRMKSHG